ncbi:MAG: zinc ribbon domain-containing protein [Polyangiaceae bacterium]|nr:zinc ribbon domain-containing protein [Polyangiaceae bacterium]
MPTYEYACASCGHQWEQLQRITEAPTEVCPKCAASTAHRLISGGTNFILKGGGWYSDLYSSAKPAAKEVAGDAKSAPDASGDGASSTKSDTKASDTKASTAPAAPASSAPASSTSS